jgi:hypothetical protein
MTELYFPQKGAWRSTEAIEAGFDPQRLASAVAFARNNETDWPRQRPGRSAASRAGRH